MRAFKLPLTRRLPANSSGAKRLLLGCVLLIIVPLSGGALALDQLRVKVLEQKPLSREYFTQGLEFHGEFLYLSSGLYGRSQLLRLRFDDMSEETVRDLDKRVFAEGVTVLGEEVYQLTWRNRAMLVFKREQLAPARIMALLGEGWGLTNNGRSLVYSDGSALLYFMSPDSGQIERTITVTEEGTPVEQLNELEWIDGEIWANVWRSDRILIINPTDGKVRAAIDLSGLLPDSEREPGTDVLNGIARDSRNNAIWVTGKRWPWLYRIELVPANENKTLEDNSR